MAGDKERLRQALLNQAVFTVLVEENELLVLEHGRLTLQPVHQRQRERERLARARL